MPSTTSLSAPMPASSARRLEFVGDPITMSNFAEYGRQFAMPMSATSGDMAQRMTLTDARWQELQTVNSTVNRQIAYAYDMPIYGFDEFLANPLSPHFTGSRHPDGRPFGDCEDFAFAKQTELLARGWPPESVVIAYVTTLQDQTFNVGPRGTAHAVLLVRTDRGDLVLDNDQGLNRISQWHDTPYAFTHVQLGARSSLMSDVSSIETDSNQQTANGSMSLFRNESRLGEYTFSLNTGTTQPVGPTHLSFAQGLEIQAQDNPYSARDGLSIVSGDNRISLTRVPNGELNIGYTQGDSGRYEAINPSTSNAEWLFFNPHLLSESQRNTLQQVIATARSMGIEWDTDPASSSIRIPRVEQFIAAAQSVVERP